MMRTLTTSKIIRRCSVAVAAVFVLGLGSVSAQFTGSYTYPQNTDYSNGRAPSNPNDADGLDAYNYWKDNFVTSSGACGERRVKWDFFSGGRGATDGSETVSEGVAYGMLLTAYAGDQDIFDDLWSYYNQHLNQNGVMNWRIQNCSVKGWNGASDAELDAAMALIVASHQWQDDKYLDDAKDLIRVIREKEFDGDILKPGDQFGGFNLVNPSYFSPAYYRVFATVETNQATFWNNAAQKGYDIIELAHNGNGLVPDWCKADGSFSNEAGAYEDNGQNFIFDAIRTPMRSAVDYLWYGTPEAAEYCGDLIDWAYDNNNGGTESLGSKYSTSGNKLDASHSNTFVGCFAVAAMAAQGSKTEQNYQSFLDRAYDDNENTTPGYGQYFNATFKALTQFILTGNFYLPPPDQCDAPVLGDDHSLCEGPSISLNGTVAGGQSYVWKKNGSVLNGQTNGTYTATSAGLYEVIATYSDGCTRRDKVTVWDDAINADFTATTAASDVVLTNTTTGGISNSTWNDGTTDFSTDRDATFSALAAGSYDITLTVDNSGFGCSDQDVITKTIVVGDGEGWVADDFNNYDIAELWGSPDGNFDDYPVTYCSRADFDAGGAQVCSDMPCSYYQVVCNGGADVQYAPFGINLREGGAYVTPDVDDIPFISLKIKSTADAEIGVGLNDGTVTTDRLKVTLVAGIEQTITLDFTNNKTGWTEADAATPVDFTAIQAIQFFPYEFDATYTGTIDIDWIILGGKSLAPPVFDLKKDDEEFPVFEYDPTNPNFDPDDEDFQYFNVSSWEEEYTACSLTADIAANACTAEEITWFNGNTVIGTTVSEETIELAPGTYTVQLANPGGITTAEVTIEGLDLVADFEIDRLNYDVHLNNASTDFDTFEWSYGDDANDLAGSKLWEVGYHNYMTAGDGTYSITLEVTNAQCNATDDITKTVTVACDQLPVDPVVVSTTPASICGGDAVEFEITPDQFAVSYGWFPPEDATIEYLNADSTKVEITFDVLVSDLTIEAYANCDDEKGSTIEALNLIPTPTGTFTVQDLSDTEKTFSPDAKDGDTYAWTFEDNGTSDEEFPTITFASSGMYDVCLTMTNSCGTSPENCQIVDIVVGISELGESEGSIFPTLTSTKLNVNMVNNETTKLVVSDAIGNLMSESTINGSGSVNVEGLVPGMYILTVQQGDNIFTKRFVKQ